MAPLTIRMALSGIQKKMPKKWMKSLMVKQANNKGDTNYVWQISKPF